MTPTTAAAGLFIAHLRQSVPWFIGGSETGENDLLAAIEAEAVVAERVRLAAAVRGLERDRGDDSWDTVARADVLALLEPK